MSKVDSLIVEFLKKNDILGFKDPNQLVSLVQAVVHIPWGEGRTIEEVLESKHVGTCTGKHLVLQACFKKLAIPHHIVVCTFRWSEQGLHMPEELKAILNEGEWNHGHNFLQIQNEKGHWIDIDVTWDSPLKLYGFRTFPEDWNGESSFVGLKSLIQRHNDAKLEMKKQWLAVLTPAEQERRERFLKKFFAWTESLRSS